MTAFAVGGGIASTPPPPDWVVPVHAPFCLRGTDVERPYIDVHGRYVLYVGDGHVQCIDWVEHARYHLPTQYFITISKLKFQTYFEIILNGRFLRLLFVYTTSNVYLTLRIKI